MSCLALLIKAPLTPGVPALNGKPVTTSADVQKALSGYVRIKFQAEDPDQPPARPVMQRFNAAGLPAYVILRPKG
jgi:hypothetical protein